MKKILLTDATLSGSNASTLGFREKLEIAKLLDTMQINCIDFGRLNNVKIDPLLVSTIAPLLRHSSLCISVGLNADEITTAAKAIHSCSSVRISLSVPVSTVGMEYTCHRKPKVMLADIEAQLRRCREICDDVELCALDATRAEPAFLSAVIAAAQAAGTKYITLCDNDGRMLPDEAAAFVRSVSETMEDRNAVTLSVAFPDDMQMAVACSIEALRAGADGIRTCVASKSCAAVLPVSEVMRARGEHCDLCCDLSTVDLRRCVSQIEAILCPIAPLAGAATAPGESASGEIISLDKNDDCISVARAVHKLGYDLSAEDETRVYEAFKNLAEKKTVNARELEAIIASTALQVPPTYRLISYLTNSGNVINASAHIKLEKDGKTLEGITVGDGPIDAAFVAIERIIGHHYELDDFQIQSVTEGREAMGNALVRLRSGGKIYSGTGISTDIIGASIRAYLSALNKIVYEEATE